MRSAGSDIWKRHAVLREGDRVTIRRTQHSALLGSDAYVVQESASGSNHLISSVTA